MNWKLNQPEDGEDPDVELFRDGETLLGRLANDPDFPLIRISPGVYYEDRFRNGRNKKPRPEPGS